MGLREARELSWSPGPLLAGVNWRIIEAAEAYLLDHSLSLYGMREQDYVEQLKLSRG